jgi:hypothetical protein
MLGTIRDSKPALAAKYREAGKDVERFADELTDEELSALVEPLSNGVDRIRDFADALDAELSEGDVRGALKLAEEAVANVGRFDPDMILGEDFAGGSLHRLIEEFLKKYSGMSGAGGEVFVEGAAVALEISDLSALQQVGLTPEEQPEIALPEVTLDEELLNPLDELDTSLLEDVDEAGDFASSLEAYGAVLSGISGDADSSADAEINQKIDDISKNFEDAISSRQEQAAALNKPALGKQEGGNANNASDFRDQRAAKAAANAKAQSDVSLGADADAAPKTNVFASDMLSALRERTSDVQLPAATQPGATYLLDADNAFGDGVSSILQFMKNDGIDEARIVVEPPALGRVDVSLQATANGVEAVFKVDNESLKQLLQQQIDILKTSLEAQGIHVSSLAVDIRNKEEQRNRGDLYGTKTKNRVGGLDALEGEEEAPTRLARIDLENGLLHWVA